MKKNFDEKMLKDFVSMVFSKIHEDLKVSIACFSKRKLFKKFYSKDFDGMVEFVSKQSGRANCYAVINPVQSKTTDRGQGTKKDVMALTCLWHDIDILLPGHSHQKKNLPSTEEDIFNLLEELYADFKPSFIIHSGFGLYPIWLLNYPFQFSSDEEREKAEELCANWQKLLNSYARVSHNWDFDNTSNINRLLRLPGSLNIKNSESPVMSQLQKVHSATKC
jgi:hypothetical protein